ncbi:MULTISPECIES: sugar phosphate nucleotidyltransferase [Rhizobium]|uniref:Glucose-1-phosphate thymidylyltransferase n=1 Tax=Rhizobium leguminosarum TaxID=384 RepID=A0A2K9ZCB7_RHILE|nr:MULTISPECIES: sugar phosphate nucleotidyltransferase [Rhizobium]AUW45882.1 Glucose-1-phosphate thymidylyltransferase [Rhizobium leguminosarum]
MIAIILAAGYGTRILPLIGTFPKALIEVRGETLLDRLCDELETLPSVREIKIVSNDLFFSKFALWAEQRNTNGRKIEIINNGTRSVEKRLGAIGDLAFAVRECGISSAIFVAASDCYFTFPLKDMYERFLKKGGNWIAAARESDPSVLVDAAVIEIDTDERITYMEEKPAKPSSDLGALPFYIYEAATLKLVYDYLSEGGNPDSPGRFPEWLYKRRKVAAFVINKAYECEDLGMPESYIQIQGSVPVSTNK